MESPTGVEVVWKTGTGFLLGGVVPVVAFSWVELNMEARSAVGGCIPEKTETGRRRGRMVS